MYNEEGFSIKSFAAKAILVILFVFLLMWLFPMPNMDPIYDRLFVDNIETMKDAAKSYFTVDRLPKDEGETVSLTLKEMKDKKLILDLVDSDGKECDARASYIEVIKMENEYVIKTNLSCSNKTDYVVEHVGCYDICGDKCETPEEKEEVAQEKEEPNKKPQVKQVVQYKYGQKIYKGYKVVDSNTSLYEQVQYDEKVDHYDYYCSDGDREGDRCRLYTTEKEPVCPYGYDPSGSSSCKKTVHKTTYECPSGYHDGGSRCYDEVTETKCPTDYVSSGDICAKPNPQCPDSSYNLSQTSSEAYICTKQISDSSNYTDYYQSSIYKKTWEAAPSNSDPYYYVDKGIGYYIGECSYCDGISLVVRYDVYKRVYKPKTITVTADTSKLLLTNKITYSTKVWKDKIPVTESYNVYDDPLYYDYNRRSYTVAAKKKAVYKKYVSDRKWTEEKHISGWEATGKTTKTSSSREVYTGWVTSLPAGYKLWKEDVRYKWSSKSSLAGWERTGESKKVKVTY